MDDEPVIKVQNVSKDFKFTSERAGTLKSLFTGMFKTGGQKSNRTQHALRDINFEIKKGEFFGIVGRNGSGKSTLLKILAGIYQPNKGKTSVNGRLVPFIELGVGFNPELTGRENVYLNGALLNFSEKEVDKFYEEVVEFAELEQFMDKKLKNYSSGMQVRLAFSMAIRAKADILLIDEVLAVGDAAFQRKCYEFFRDLKRHHTTVVFVSHDMDAIKRFCDRAVMIENSELIKVGDVEEVADDYTRMFLREAEATAGHKESDQARWGDRAITYDNAEVLHTEHDSKAIIIKASLTCHEAIDDVSLGYLVKNFNGQAITGTNSKREKLHLGRIKKGKSYAITWEVPQIFNEGEYSVELAASHDDGQTADWWQGASTFRVFVPKATPFLVDPKVKARFNES